MFEQDEKVSYLVDHETGMTVEHGTILEAHADHRFYSIRTEDGSITYQPYEKLSRVVPFNDGEDSKRADYYAELYTDLRNGLICAIEGMPATVIGSESFDNLTDAALLTELNQAIFRLARKLPVLAEFIDGDGDTWIRNEEGMYKHPNGWTWPLTRVIETFGMGMGN